VVLVKLGPDLAPPSQLVFGFFASPRFFMVLFVSRALAAGGVLGKHGPDLAPPSQLVFGHLGVSVPMLPKLIPFSVRV
jgi:hypothetical protein